MQLITFGDLHFRRTFFEFVARVVAEDRFDAVCLAGDFLDAHPNAAVALPRQVEWVVDWFEKLHVGGRTRVFAVSGNHDWCPDKPNDEAGWLQRARRPGIAIDGDVVAVAGFNVVCRPWVGEIEPPPGPTVLLAHAPPEGADVANRRGWDAGGDYSTRLVAESLQGTGGIVLSGHVHEPDEWIAYVGDVACFNPGCDLMARVPRHVVIDTVARRAEFVTAEGVVGPVAF